jgi:hypothetical protein
MDRREPASHGWCSLRLRFDESELALLKSAEQLRGATLSHTTRSDTLRAALSLAKAGHKIALASPGASVSLDEPEVALFIEALRFAVDEVQWASRASNGQEGGRRDAISKAFPELVEKGSWRTFGLVREIETLAGRLQTALSS